MCLVFSRIITNVENVKINENKNFLERHFNIDSRKCDNYIQELKFHVQNNVEKSQFYEFNVCNNSYFLL